MNARNKISSLQRHIGPAICMLLLFAASPARAMSDPARPCPRCLGDICFAESAPPAVPLWERYGRGFVENPEGTLCTATGTLAETTGLWRNTI